MKALIKTDALDQGLIITLYGDKQLIDQAIIAYNNTGFIVITNKQAIIDNMFETGVYC